MTLLFADRQEVVVCRGCGCDDNHACVTDEGPCSWALLDLDGTTGVCSVCAERARWHPLMLAAGGRDGPLGDYVAAGLERYVDDLARPREAAA